MHITPSYSIAPTEEEKAENAKRLEEEAARHRRQLEAERAASAKANGATVTLSETTLSALADAMDDQRLRRNIQWGIVRGLAIWSLIMIPVAFVFALIISGLK